MGLKKLKNYRPLTISLGIHAVLIILFIFIKYTLPAQPYVEELGIEVNLGSTEDGFGNEQPEIAEAPAQENSPSSSSNEKSAEDIDSKNISVTEDKDANVAITEKKTKIKKEVVKVNKDRKDKKPEIKQNQNTTNNQSIKPKHVYTGERGKGGNSAEKNVEGGNEGIGKGEGDMGVAGGTPGVDNYVGQPGKGGTSWTFNLTNRSIVNYPDKAAEFKEGGKVVFHITVNREGVITNARPTLSSNAALLAIAQRKIKSVKFNKAAGAPPEQKGYITFDFRTTRNQ